MVNDRIADMLTRIRNANQMKYDTVEVLGSKMTEEISRILKEEGYISDYKVSKNTNGDIITLNLKYSDGKNLVAGANIAGFVKVCEAMKIQGVAY